MDPDDITYQSLRRIQDLEKNSPGLSRISPHFFGEVTQYLYTLKHRLEKEQSSQKKLLLKDEIENTKKIAENIYEHREKKIILASISKARGGKPNLSNCIASEKTLFDNIMAHILHSREKIWINSTIEKKTEKNNQREKKETSLIINKNPIIKVVEDIPKFIGTDMKQYHLRKNDVLSLPETIKKILEKRDVVKEIKDTITNSSGK